MLQTQTAAANTHNAKFIRLKTEAPQAPAQPAKRKVKVLTDKGGRYYLNAKGQKVYIK